MTRVNDLNALGANESRCLHDKRQLERSDWQRMKGNAQLLRNLREFAFSGAGQPNFVPEFRERVRDPDRTIISASA